MNSKLEIIPKTIEFFFVKKIFFSVFNNKSINKKNNKLVTIGLGNRNE